ncbi:hypothetical protein BGZ88_011522 [Linnemannia elongata]|nr:hypothetical protein BGZ88_011522 [Linnemannia elongata]
MMPAIDLWDQKHQHQKQSSHHQQAQAQQQLPQQLQQSQQYLNQPSHYQQQQVPPERRFILSSPPSFTRARKSSVDSAGSLTESERARTISNNSNNSSVSYTTANIGRHGRYRSNTGGDEMMMPSVQRSSPLQSDPPQQPPVAISGASASGGGGGVTSKYEVLLKQIAAQRTKLNVLNAGAQTLTKDIAALDETLGEEQDSREAVLQDASRAVDGWDQTWTAYSKCEPVEVLQERPNALASLIQGMSWEDKKELFEQLVRSCRPRETYQLQHQLTIRHGQVYGFDLLEELPTEISTLVLKNLSFSDLTNCRLVSRAWKQMTMTYDVLLAAMDRVTYADDMVDMDKQDDAQKNWNQLCRYQERDLRWKQRKPASAYLMTGHTSYVTSLKDRGGWIISGGYDEKVRLWEAATGKCVKIWEVDSAVSCVELLVDSNMEGGGVVAAAFVDIGLVKVWSLHGPLNMYTLTGHQKGVRALAINESYLVTAGFDQTVLVWNWATGRKVASFRAHNEVILSVHLTKTTVYTFCIDATLRVFDIPSRTLLHQVKLFEVQPGSSLQWSCLQGKMFLTATNRKVYVWQMEHLESLVQQQQQQQQQSLQRLLRFRSPSAMSLASSSDLASEQQQHYSPPISPSRTPLGPTPSSSLTNLTLQPDTPAPSSSTLSLVTNINTTESIYEGFGASAETRVKPCLTAVLTVPDDMWCGNVTHHDPPLLLIGSRSSPVKLSSVALTRDIIDPDKVYNNEYTPLQTSPKSWPFQSTPTGQGRGVMCIDSSSGRVAMGCTGGTIHILNMDPKKRSLASLRSNTAATVVTLPHLTPTQMDSIRSVSPVNPPLPQAPVPTKTVATTTTVIATTNGGGYPRKPSSTVFRNNTNTNSAISGRSGVPVLPSPNQSPTTTAASSMLFSPTTHLPRNSPPRGGIISSLPYNSKSAKKAIPQSEFEEQEVLVDSYDGDILREFGDSDMSKISSLDFSFKTSSPSSSTCSLTSSVPSTLSTPPKEDRRRSKDLLKPLSIGGKAGTSAKSLPTSPTFRATTGAGGAKSVSNRSPSYSNATSTPTPTSSSSYTSQTLSSLSKFIPSSPGKMMMRRRANSTAWTQQVTSTATTTITKAPSPSDGTVTTTTGTITSSSSSTSRPINIPSPVSALTMKGRNRSDPNLLASVHAVSESPVSTPRSLAKSWSLPSPWNSPSRIGSKK